jgi:hypothetical protein
MSAASGGGDAGAWLRISPDGLADLLECPEDFTAIMLPLCRWYMGLRFERPKGLRGAVFDMMQAGQERNLATWRKASDGGRKGGQAKSERKAETARANGCNGGRPRKAENPSPLEENPSNETERNGTKPNITERNETRTPQAATVSPPLSSDSVSSVAAHGAPDNAAIDAAIVDAAQLLGDGLPSRDKWRRFMLAHGVAVFRDKVEKAAAAQGVEKRGAYLNRLLDAYTPPPVHATATAPKPLTWTREDWGLCEERCAHFNAEKMACPYSRIPPEHAKHPHPPEECPHFERCADYGENTPPVGLAALAGGIAKTADTHGA